MSGNTAIGQVSYSDAGRESSQAEENIIRAMQILDTAVSNHFVGEGMSMARFYNPYTQSRSAEKGSVWMYTAAIESVVAVLDGLKAHKTYGNPALYVENVDRYSLLLEELYTNLAYYQGTFPLISYTQTREWTVYGVHRANKNGDAKVAGIENVYDDQQWLVRELIQAYQLTNDKDYIQEAEYLTEYVLDGWDSTPDENGKPHGGIPWGPGYVTKHACSNGPMVSPLVWLHEIYKDSDEEIEHRFINPKGKRTVEKLKKADYYLQFAEAIYDWQKKLLLREDGVYYDMMGGCGTCEIAYETVDGVTYRAHTPLTEAVGRAYSYNAGTMLSAAADLYRATGQQKYWDDLTQLSEDSFVHFAKQDLRFPGYYTYAVDGFNNWFNGVLMRGYVDVFPTHATVDTYISSFQKNLDYAYEHHLYRGVLPTDLLYGWDNKNGDTEGMFSFTFAAKYAILAKYELQK